MMVEHLWPERFWCGVTPKGYYEKPLVPSC